MVAVGHDRNHRLQLSDVLSAAGGLCGGPVPRHESMAHRLRVVYNVLANCMEQRPP